MFPFFKRLGDHVLHAWKETNFSPESFPGISRQAMTDLPPADHVEWAGLIDDFLRSDDQAEQSASGFGQPELIVYEHTRFYIQVLFWLDGTTDIHQHGFSGAFHVLDGSSLHSTYRFDDRLPVTANFQLGRLELMESRILERGDTCEIVSGTRCIHSLFHLETPSVTVVIRTHSDPGSSPQFTYLPPHVAIDPIHYDALTMRRKQVMDLLEYTGDPDYAVQVVAMVRELDLERGFLILQNGVFTLRRMGAWDEVWSVFEERHGAAAEGIGRTLDEIIRRDGLTALRGAVEWVEHRFFLSLLLNVPDRDPIMTLIGEKFPGDPQATILRWAGELLEFSDSHDWLLDAEIPVVNGAEPGEMGDEVLEALRVMISGAGKENLSESGEAIYYSLLNSSWAVLAKE